ncbi:hypothetical protein NliqN6_4386 [Naganishia liquefaciens]|uniref:Uncharacterized protein n=1 Tax=Naganishia liquefaciens TaxID=104408 RepID=A0A8H3YFT8_9TREE|nr:hypothetical protein NliqN6_4386 [Naganishia liquefaciens]
MFFAFNNQPLWLSGKASDYDSNPETSESGDPGFDPQEGLIFAFLEQHHLKLLASREYHLDDISVPPKGRIFACTIGHNAQGMHLTSSGCFGMDSFHHPLRDTFPEKTLPTIRQNPLHRRDRALALICDQPEAERPTLSICLAQALFT